METLSAVVTSVVIFGHSLFAPSVNEADKHPQQVCIETEVKKYNIDYKKLSDKEFKEFNEHLKIKCTSK